ncbi:MAG: PTS cellobiose transporter subunit IIC [Alistipes sp.]|nr:PTS cellobiose transporter subunit IIC [Alistipes sp.]
MLYDIHHSTAATFESALDEILAAVTDKTPHPLRVVIFGTPASNEDYLKQRFKFEQACADAFSPCPLLAYVAHAPLGESLVAEVTYMEDEPAKIERHSDYIIVDDEYILSAGLHSDITLHTGEQADNIFSRMNEIFATEGVTPANIVRQWNYIENITDITPYGQNYQLFNDSRSQFYNSCSWDNGYPAATGIGTQFGGVVVVFDVMRHSAERSRAIDNPLQISAHSYSQQVLISPDEKQHKTTPKFERARHIEHLNGKQMLYISGTAAIRGENSCREDIIEQTVLTMENINTLASAETMAKYGVVSPADLEYTMLRIYLKHDFNLDAVKQWFDENYPSVEKVYLLADICREELLIEIEGIAAEK